jgi:hypothetical protein
MEKDDPEAVKQLRALNSLLNEKVKEAQIAKETIYEAVRSRILALGFVFDEELTHLGSCKIRAIVEQVLDGYWRLYIGDSPSPDRPSYIMPDLASYIKTHCQIVTADGVTRLSFDQTPIAKGTDHEMTTLKVTLESCATDSTILGTISSLFAFSHVDELSMPIAKVIAAAREISNNIDEEIYTTKAKCCPTFLRLVRDYLF